MIKFLRSTALILVFLFGVLLAHGQDKLSVAGKVTDETGTGLPGAAVIIKGSTVGTITDLEGKFQLSAPASATLVVSFLGYESQTLEIDGRSFIDVSLVLDITSLEEIIVVGYGEVKKSDLTGAVSSVTSKAINDVPTPFLDKALQGQAAGVLVTTASAAPGGGAQIRIRGANSLSSGADPLFVIDGFPAGVSSDVIQTLNPQDIKSMEILKDASATSIYGSRGANGVVLITTKRGQAGKPQIQYSNFFSIEQVNGSLNMLNGAEFAMIYNEYLENTGQAPFYNGQNRYQPLPERVGEGTDWIDAITENGVVQNHQLTVMGGSERSKYSISTGYVDHDGVIKGGRFKRGVIRINLDNELSDWLSMGSSVNLNRNVTDGSGDNTNMETGEGTINSAVKMTPVLPVFDVYGNYTENNIPDAQRRENALAQALEVQNRNTTDNILANLFVNINPMEGLDIKLSAGTILGSSRRNSFTTSRTVAGRNARGIAVINTTSRSNYLAEGLITYNKSFGIHNLNVTGLVSRQIETNEFSQIQGTGFPSDALSVNNMSSAEEISNVTSFKNKWQLASYMGRVNYGLMNKYLVTATIRADGSSRFGPENQWGVFPSVAVAWKIQNEPFFEAVSSVLSEAKVRVSYGTVGNSEFGLYQSQGLLNLTSNAVLGGNEVSGSSPQANPGNPDLRWETTAMYNVGLDLGLFNSKLKITSDVYLKTTDDFILGLPLPQTSGYTTITKNIDATIETKGVDLLVDYQLVDTKVLNWNIIANLSAYRSVYSRFNENGGQLFKDDTYIAEDVEVGVFRGQVFDGIFKSEEEVEAYVGPEGDPVMPQAQPGDVRWVDVNNDGIINSEDQEVIGNPNPDFTFGLTNRVSYKKFELSFLFTGSVGNDIRNNTGRYLGAVGVVRNNLSRGVLDRYHPENNPDGNYMALGGIGQMPFIEDGAYLRLQNVRLSYNVPVNVSFISSLSVYGTINNVFLITDYEGFDPDINTTNAQDGRQRPLSLGRDNSAFPRPRVYTVGFNVKF